MTLMSPSDEKAERLNRLLTAVLYRAAGLMLFGLGAAYWIRLVGIHEGALWRFDLMPVSWKAASAALAVLYPVAGVGLWMTVSWGAVIWTLIVLIEGVMHLGLPAVFGGAGPILFLNVLGLAMLAAVRIVGWHENRRRLRRIG